MVSIGDDRVAAWLEALDRRHLADLTPSEVARALRALSSCYVERRDRIAGGGPLDSAGKRAAFALFYAPLHFIVSREVLEALPGSSDGVREVLDIGCGTGTAGAAWALHSGAASVRGFDRNPWAAAEANWTYRQLGLTGRAAPLELGRTTLQGRRGTAAIVAYVANELADHGRAALLEQLLALHQRGARVLVIEPIARRAAPWWAAWERVVLAAGGRADEWRFPSSLPPRQHALARAAGLDPRELTARTLWLPAVRG
jgi:SAM-dependent methyltransferase